MDTVDFPKVQGLLDAAPSYGARPSAPDPWAPGHGLQVAIHLGDTATGSGPGPRNQPKPAPPRFEGFGGFRVQKAPSEGNDIGIL